MDPATIQQIAAEVVARLPYGDRYWLVVYVVVAALVGAVAALGTSYFRTRGQNLATKHDFDELQKQLKANTELVETIKSEVGQRDWAQREWTILRRMKLEELLQKMHECQDMLLEFRRKAGEGQLPSDPTGHHSHMNTLAALYFPELEKETTDFLVAWMEQVERAIKLASEVSLAGEDRDARQKARDKHMSDFTPDVHHAAAALRSSSRKLLLEIVGFAPLEEA
jgi:hypothetical protein